MSKLETERKTNAFTHLVCPDLLGKTPQGKTMTFAVKANIGCGQPASVGTPSLKDQVPRDFSPVVRSLLDAGYKLVAIANMHELASGITSENPGCGDVDNPRSPGFIPGGSSGGSAASVAMGAVTFALGSDTGGSMRIPASLCGVVGYRPTTGLYDTTAVCPLSETTDTIGIFARYVEDIQNAHRAVVEKKKPYSPLKASLKGVRIGVPRQYYWSVLDDEVSRLTESALEALKKAGVELVDAEFPSEDFNDNMTQEAQCLVSYEANDLIPKYLAEQHPSVSYQQLCEQVSDPVVKQILENAKGITTEQYEQCVQKAEKIRKRFDEYFEGSGVVGFLCPTTILPAVKRPSPETVTVKGKKLPTRDAYVHNSVPQALGGVPCISLPCGLTSEGLAVGLELVCPRHQDARLLDLAAAVQDVLPPMPELFFQDFKDRL